MNPIWILWIYVLGVLPFGLAVTRYALWMDYTEFVEDLALSILWCSILAVVWPIVVVAVTIVLVAMPRQRRREWLTSMITPDRAELDKLSHEALIEKVQYLEKRLDKQVKEEIEELKKEYTKGAH